VVAVVVRQLGRVFPVNGVGIVHRVLEGRRDGGGREVGGERVGRSCLSRENAKVEVGKEDIGGREGGKEGT